MDIFSLEARYLDSCKRNGVIPNSAVLSWLSKSKMQKSLHEQCRITIFLDQLKDDDISPLHDLLKEIDSSDIDAVDILHESPCALNEASICSLMHAINLKLRVVELQDVSFGKDFLRGICQAGLACEVLNLASINIRKLNMVGTFMQLHTLNLDFCTSLTSLEQDTFASLPNLMRLSMCETRVGNMWTTTAALSNLQSLVELRFQNCLCCKDTGPCPTSSGDSTKSLFCVRDCSPQLNVCSYSETPSMDNENSIFHSGKDEAVINSLNSSSMTSETKLKTDNLSGNSELGLSNQLQRTCLAELSSNLSPYMTGQVKLQNEIKDKDVFLASGRKRDLMTTPITLKKYTSHHPSPICFEKHYREYMVASLPYLEVLDNLPVGEMDREVAKTIFSKCYEYLPYKRQCKESVTGVLLNREMGTSDIGFRKAFKTKQSRTHHRKSQYFFSRSLGAAKLGSSTWPLLYPVSNFGDAVKEDKKLRPRQFEYHPSNPFLMACGTLDGEVAVINHESGNIVGYVHSTEAMNSVLGLSWLKKHPSKLVAGSDNGSVKLLDINHMLPIVDNTYCNSGTVTFDNFEQLTSVHINSVDDQFLVSGYSKDIALYDISSGKRLQLFSNLHQEPINVAKFAHHSPFLFATSSFDRDVKMWDLRLKPIQPCYTTSSSRGNVMVCFSPDDLYLLVSAVDNEVKQLSAADGRLHMNFEIASTGSAHNYTRSYYMNGRDYVISGSCDEHVIRICCAQTGRRLRDVYLEDMESGNSTFVQSLRGDPFRHFHLSILATSVWPTSKWEIIKVNLLSSNTDVKEHSYGRCTGSSFGL